MLFLDSLTLTTRLSLRTVKDMIIRGGENVSANAVEDAAYAASLGIKECAAVAAPDKRYGETVALVCVPIDPKNAPSVEMVKEKLRARLPVVSLAERGQKSEC